MDESSAGASSSSDAPPTASAAPTGPSASSSSSSSAGAAPAASAGAPAAAPSASGPKMVQLTAADVKKLMDAALRMQRANQTAHPKYAQIVSLLRQFHQRRQAQAQAQAGGDLSLPSSAPAELVRQPPAQQALALLQSAAAPLVFTEKQLEHLHNQIRAYKALCHSMDEAVAGKKSGSGGSAVALTPPLQQPQQPPQANAVAIPTTTELAQRQPQWTRAARGLRYVGPACFDGDLLGLEAKAASAFGPYSLNSPWLGLNDVTLKLRYMHTLQQFLTASLAALEARPSTALRPAEQRTLRDLRCVLLQQKLRNRVARTYTKQLALLGAPAAVDRKSFRRRRPVARVALASEQKAKRRKSVALEKQRRAAHQLYLRAVLGHARDFFAYHKNVKLQLAKAAKGAKAAVEHKISRAEREEDRQEKLRLKALKANDMEAYGKLVAEAKNERLTYLLGQTNSYLDSIRKLVREHKRKHNVAVPDAPAARVAVASDSSSSDKADKADNAHADKADNGDDDDEDDLNYLEVASKGELPRQPMMLVKRNRGPFLVVVPLSTLSNWVNEFKKWAPDLLLVVYKGHPQVRKDLFRLEMASSQFNVLLTTYEYIMKDKHVLRKYDWQYIIVDEGHRMKNAQSKFAMTLGSSVDTFEQWFSKPFSQFSGSGETNEQLSDEERMLIINRLHQVLRPFLLRRVKSSVLDQLPDKVERVLKCDLSGWQKILYRRIQEGGALLMESAPGDRDAATRKHKTKYTSKGLSNVLMQLRKVCNHPYLFQVQGYPIDFDIVRASGKFELLDRMLPKLQAAGHRVLMFSQMTQLMHVLEDYFAYRGFRYLRLDGSTSADEREQRMFILIKMESEEAAHAASGGGGSGGGAGGGDDDSATVLLDDEINEMMALTDEELALYQRLDAERVRREEKEWADQCRRLKQPLVPRSRLMHETDVPEWLREADAQMESDIASGKHVDKNSWQFEASASGGAGGAGGGGRKRKEVSYRDAFTDSEFVKMCEDGIDDDNDNDNDNDDDDDDDDDASPPPPATTTTIPTVTVVGGGKRRTREQRKVLCYFYRKVYDGVVKLADATGRLRCELYLEKPSAVEYPDYYSVVTAPMDLATIKARIDAHAYGAHAQFEDDVKLMVANAQLYNHPQSLVYYDALEIDKFVKAKMKRVRQKSAAQLAAEYDAAKQQHKMRSKARKEKKRARHT
ncbi:hypothetical protein PybrP1_006751 [[Pythium] brassicae (nom. inval.)]|nr:hypothetical protein PybrP1_006751 [[Pythium] brassicae (nom. inval.)]